MATAGTFMGGLQTMFGVGKARGIGGLTALGGTEKQVRKAVKKFSKKSGGSIDDALADVSAFRQGMGTGLKWAGGITAASTGLDVVQGEGSIMGTGFGVGAAYGLFRGGRGLQDLSKTLSRGIKGSGSRGAGGGINKAARRMRASRGAPQPPTPTYPAGPNRIPIPARGSRLQGAGAIPGRVSNRLQGLGNTSRFSSAVTTGMAGISNVHNRASSWMGANPYKTAMGLGAFVGAPAAGAFATYLDSQ